MSLSFLGLDLEEVCEVWTLRLSHHPFSSCWNHNSCALMLKLPLDWKPAQQVQTLMNSLKKKRFYICLVTNLILASPRRQVHQVPIVLKCKHFSPSLFTSLKSFKAS